MFIKQAQAQITNPAIGDLGQYEGAPGDAAVGQSFLDYFLTLWQTIITIGGLAVLLYFLWGAIEWITAGGDKGKIESARNRIVQAIIGMILLASSYVIINAVNILFFGGVEGFDLLNLTFPGAGS